ncbi:ABC transporter [Novosphingobium resinovorum]
MKGWRASPLIAGLLLAACGQGAVPRPQGEEVIGLYSSLPIAWNESKDIKGLLADDSAPHWALEILRAQGRAIPLDTLANAQGGLPLPENGVLVLAQPRPLTAQENVALDAWVRGGGRVLLFVDPMLTVHSRFGPGDPRRPQDIAMLSPILARWGLQLQFDDTQEAGERLEGGIPVNLAGRFKPLGKSGAARGKPGMRLPSAESRRGDCAPTASRGRGAFLRWQMRPCSKILMNRQIWPPGRRFWPIFCIVSPSSNPPGILGTNSLKPGMVRDQRGKDGIFLILNDIVR